MYYEEAVIDGILMYRSLPNGPWKRVGEKELTRMLMEERNQPGKLAPYEVAKFLANRMIQCRRAELVNTGCESEIWWERRCELQKIANHLNLTETVDGLYEMDKMQVVK